MYCRSSHLPGVPNTPAREFRKGGLLRDCRDIVMEYRDGKDAYTKRSLTKKYMGDAKLDHVLEIHVVRDAFDKVKKQGRNFLQRQQVLKDELKDLVNEETNLNFTTSSINNMKYSAFKEFQEDYNRGSVHKYKDAGLYGYLRTRSHDSTKIRLSRDVSRRIRRETIYSYDFISDCLQEEDGLQGDFVEYLHDNMVAMRLF